MLDVTRRRFIKSSALLVAAPGLLGLRRRPVLEGLNIAIIGAGGRGKANLSAVAHENIRALCDVDGNTLAAAAQRFPTAATYSDYRIMLDEVDDIDAVVVSTPDHSHAPATAAALRRGLHVYCEKPLTHTVSEAREIARLAKQHGVATQMGTQIHAGDNYRRVVELIQSGAIGAVREVHVWCGKSWSNGRFRSGAAPAHLDWDLWLGPTPKRAYSPKVHPADWRRFWAYGTGTLGDMGCHYLDLVHWALDLRNPLRVHTLGPARHDDGTPDSIIVRSDYPARGPQPPVRVTWYDGSNRPSILTAMRHENGSPVGWGDGQLFVGDDGFLLSDYGRYMLLPESRFASFEPPPPTIATSIGHHREWLDACRNGGSTTCNFEYAGALTESVLLGTVAFRVGRPIEWDGAALRSPNAPEAAAFVEHRYRDGWTL